MAKLLTFDVTNTILRVAGSVGYQYAHIAKKFGVSLDVNAINAAFKGVWRDHTMKYPNFGEKAGLTPQRWWAGLVEESFRLAGYSVPDEQLRPIKDELYQYFYSPEPWEIILGSRETLDKLDAIKKCRTLSVGVVSNFDARLEPILSNLGIIHHFDFVLASFVVKSAKPDSAIFMKALDISGVNPNDAIHVGDHVTNDYYGACAVGMRALLLGDPDKVPPEIDRNHVIKSLDEVFQFLE